MLNSIRDSTMSGAALPGDSMWQGYMTQYVNNWEKVQQAIQAANIANLVSNIPTTTAAAAPAEAAPVERERRGGRGGRQRDAGFVGGGYAQPGQVNANTGSWGNVLTALGGAAGGDVDRAARKAARNGGAYTEEPKERTRERSRTHTSKDGTTTTSTNVNISRNGGTAVAIDSGSDGNSQKRKKKKNSEMIY